ncbi:DUF4214 domain-containing protein [Telluria aromaticivorans]
MTTVRIKLSQAVVDTEQKAEAANPAFNDDLGSLVDLFATTSHAIGQNYPYYTSYSFLGSTLRLNFDDGAFRTYNGVQMVNPNAASGTATATNSEFVAPGALTFSVAGQLNYDYVIGANGLSLMPSQTQASTLNAIRIATHVPTYSPYYEPTVGNVSVVLNGALSLSGNGALRGTLNKLTATSDKYILSGVIEGQFNVSGDLNSMGQGLSHGVVEGMLTAYQTAYRDGSFFNVTNTQTQMRSTDSIMANLLRASAGNDDIVVELPARLYEDVVVDAGAGNDLVTLAGGGGRLHANGGAGNDLVSLLGGSHRIDGGIGLDVVKLAGLRADATVKAGATAPAFTVTDKSGATNQLVNVERIVFADGTLALDIDGNAGQAYRLYQAAFNRTPDGGGLGYWIGTMDKGSSLDSVAANFINSAEFKGIYGVNPTSQQLVARFYENILHRAPEAAGLAYWSDLLERRAATVAEVLADISESGENKAALVGVIGNGFGFTPYGEG